MTEPQPDIRVYDNPAFMLVAKEIEGAVDVQMGGYVSREDGARILRQAHHSLVRTGQDAADYAEHMVALSRDEDEAMEVASVVVDAALACIAIPNGSDTSIANDVIHLQVQNVLDAFEGDYYLAIGFLLPMLGKAMTEAHGRAGGDR